jgi:hydroxyacylglutathione hydrolase
MRIRQLELGPMANFAYLIEDPSSKECAAVDPAWDLKALLDAADEDGCRITRILATHGHADHVNGAGDLSRRLEVPVHIHAADAAALRGLKRLETAADGQKIAVGGLSVEALHTPEHTEGSQCFLVEGALLTGDTLFIGACGRTDLPGSDPEKMYRSLRRLAGLPDGTVIWPGHAYAPESSAPMGVERRRNPYLRAALEMGPGQFCRLAGGE